MALEASPAGGVVQESHPSPEDLARFMTGRLSREQVRAVVRHLLRGCPRCSAETARIWRLAEEPFRWPGEEVP